MRAYTYAHTHTHTQTHTQTNKHAYTQDKGQRKFGFDGVIPPESDNNQAYELAVSSIVRNVLQGFNGTVFAYGQTGSGKTYTVFGSREKNVPGIVTNAFQEIFDYVEATPLRMFLIRAYFLEVYQEKVCDLLTGEDNLDIQVGKEGKVGVAGASYKVVSSLDEVMAVIGEGVQRQHVGSSHVNVGRSSRAHTLFKLIIESAIKTDKTEGKQVRRGCGHKYNDGHTHTHMHTQGIKGKVLVSELNFVDLAGSEALTYEYDEGQRKETKAINVHIQALTLTMLYVESMCRSVFHVSACTF